MIRHLITELQSFGLRFQGGLTPRKGGAGPAEGGTFLIQGIPVSFPIGSHYVAKSPYVLKEEGGRWLIFKNEEALCQANFIDRPKFYSYSTGEGLPYSRIALLHGNDCLATTVIQSCEYWHPRERCRFCGIALSYESGQTLRIKKPEILAEVARKAKELDRVQHIVLTTGTMRPPGTEIHYLARSAAAIKEATGLPIHAQFCPPSHLDGLNELKEAGVDSVGIHIESFDAEILSGVAPTKAALGFKRYEQAWKKAVDLFGPNQVSSFLIVGLGEKMDSVVQGSERLADLGVYPYVVPLRPIPGSLMEDFLPPDAEAMKHLYETVASVLKRKGLSSDRSLAGCVRCGACSALHAFEEGTDSLICHPARTRAEQAGAYEIRKEIFVLEQKLFSKSDQDGNDAKSIHLVAELDHQIVGTVRIYPADGNGHWVGGRLAVKKAYRKTGAGELLVREAMYTVKNRGCTKFTAHVQMENVDFFLRMGWRAAEPMKDYCGKPHQLMEADFEKI